MFVYSMCFCFVQCRKFNSSVVSKMCYLISMFLMPLLQVSTATTYTVTPDSNKYIANTSLQYYVINANDYFISHNKLKFLPGVHYLQSDLVIHNIANFTMTGNNSTIICSGSQVGLSIVNVKGFTLQHISLSQCGKDYSSILNKTLNIHSHYETLLLHWIAALYIQQCASVTIKNMSVTVDTGINGLVAVNVMEMFNITNVRVFVNCLLFNDSITMHATNGIVLYFYDQMTTEDNTFMAANPLCYDQYTQLNNYVTIKNFKFYSAAACSKASQNALSVILTQLLYNITIKVVNSSFSDLHNASVLYYYGESCGTNINNTLVFKNCQVQNNTGDMLTLFLILAHNNGSIFSSVEAKQKCDRCTNFIKFINSSFTNNSNIHAMISIVPINTLSSNLKITIQGCIFYQNYIVQIMKSQTYARLLWQMSHYIVILSTNISFNTHKDGLGLISLTNGMIKFGGNTIIRNNSYYASIVNLYLSILKFHGSCDISYNIARNVLKAKEGSYYILKIRSSVVIKGNTVHSVVSEAEIHNEQQGEICNLQFVSNRKNLDEMVANNKTMNFSMKMIDNIYTAPTHLLHPVFSNCTWLADTAFHTAKSSDVFNRVINITSPSLHVSKANIGVIPSSICKCSNSTTYNCTSHELGETYPGQTLIVHLIVPQYLSIQSSTNIPLTLKAEYRKLPEHSGCRIIEPTEILQAHSTYECNQFNFTVWSDSDNHECELYLSGNGDNFEIFYIKLQPCPLGFSLQSNGKSKTCSCDGILLSYLSVSPCNLDNRTIYRPPNMWIAGYTTENNSHSYVVSLHCPFDYCLPHSSRLDLLAPNSQCQFRRSGVLCGHCQDGFSTVFGTSHCKHCSNVYLTITIPIAIAGVVLVLMLFLFNLTVTNGAINTFIFYVNIISINISMFFPKCHSPICIFVSLSNLDLGLETCFYDGMDGYAKMWLQLVFPFYLIAIALALIMGSRYSTRVQRLTAQRGLPVLATLFLLSYTKILMVMCHVLFFFTFITRLPGKHSELVWSVDTSIPKFGAKFIVLFTVCLFLLLILLSFNTLLLFTRVLSRFKFINTFKPLLDAYFGPYRDSFFFWTGLQLLMRAIFFGLSALDKDTSLTIGIILLGILLCVQGVVHPFKSRFKNIQESLILLNLLAVYVTALYNNTDDKSELPVAKHLIIVVFSYFMIFITYHCVTTMLRKRIDRIKSAIIMYFIILKKKFMTNKEPPEVLDMESFTSRIPDVARNYKEFQEPLIALND